MENRVYPIYIFEIEEDPFVYSQIREFAKFKFDELSRFHKKYVKMTTKRIRKVMRQSEDLYEYADNYISLRFSEENNNIVSVVVYGIKKEEDKVVEVKFRENLDGTKTPYIIV